MTTSVKVINDLLPQTQCGECGFAGCLPYAEALLQKQAPINRCPPGGKPSVNALGELLNIKPETYEANDFPYRPPALAEIREEECIGCTKCIQACPVDAIVGSAKRMHAIIETECTGCGLCVEPCPVDCITMVAVAEPAYEKETAKKRYESKQIRLLREQHAEQQHYRAKRQLDQQSDGDKDAKKSYILQALERVKAKKYE